MHVVTLRVRTATAALLLASFASTDVPAARADTDQVGSEPRSRYERMRLETVAVDNNASEVVIDSKVKRLHRARYDLEFFLDTGVQSEAGGELFSGWRGHARIKDRRNKKFKVKLYDANGDAQPRVACPGASGTLSFRRDTVRVAVPQTCLGLDVGMMSVHLALRAPRSGKVFGAAQTRVVQLGPRGAAYGDVNGDGRVDSISETSTTASTYRVDVNTGSAVLSATAPRSDDVPWRPTAPISALDVDHDGDSEVVGDPADALGDGSIRHLFTMVDGQLRLVREAGGEPFPLLTSAAGSTYYNDYRCTASGLETWTYLGRSGDLYTVRVSSWSFASGTATLTGSRDVAGVPENLLRFGNWSNHSCAVG